MTPHDPAAFTREAAALVAANARVPEQRVGDDGAVTLTEFLLARIGEDESAAQGAGSFTPWDETFQNDNYGHLTIQPARVLADCEAKRRIVERCGALAQSIDPNIAIDAASTLRDLAAIHAGHPDFREAWR